MRGSDDQALAIFPVMGISDQHCDNERIHHIALCYFEFFYTGTMPPFYLIFYVRRLGQTNFQDGFKYLSKKKNNSKNG